MERVLNKSLRDFSKPIELLQFIAIFICTFIVPLVVTGSQLVIGSIVNTALILTAINTKGWKKVCGIITLPSIVTILSGCVFKTAAPLMVFMIPAIWLGNFALVYTFKGLLINKKINYALTSIIGVGLKVAIIFGTFSVLNILNVFPEKLVGALSIAMSTTQCITATISAVVCYIIYKMEKRME